MKETLLTYALPVLGWGLLSLMVNLAFGYKSQIEAWAESHPRVAGLLKLTRALGLDPWNALAALKLLAQNRLPDAQKADSAIARHEQRKADAKRLGIDDDKDPPAGGKAVGVSGTGPWVNVDAKTPPSLPGVSRFVAIGWMLFACLLLPACGLLASRASERCSFANPGYTAQVAACRAEIAETCLLNQDETPREDCPALLRCEEWRKQECR